MAVFSEAVVLDVEQLILNTLVSAVVVQQLLGIGLRFRQTGDEVSSGSLDLPCLAEDHSLPDLAYLLQTRKPTVLRQFAR